MEKFKKPAEYETADITARMLYDQFTEEVAKYMTDSSCVLGYTYERNRKRNLFTEPSGFFKADVCTTSKGENYIAGVPVINMFQYLCKELEYDKEVDDQFQEWYKEHDYSNALLDGRKEGTFVPKGFNIKSWTLGNTCNSIDALDGSFLYASHGWDCSEGNDFIIIWIHGGADVRTGYSSPRVYKLKRDYYSFWIGTWSYSVSCQGDGDLVADGTAGESLSMAVVPEKEKEGKELLESFPVEAGDEPVRGKLIVNKDGEVFCPYCDGVLRCFMEE